MNYQETIEYIFSALPMFQRVGAAAYKANLDTSRALDLYDGAPHRNYATIHVGGTNGKGSVSHMLAAILQRAGLRTGLFTSPHMIDFRERIRVNGEKISESFVVDYVESHLDIYDELKPSFFEMIAAMAFSYFADQQVDIAIIEVGMGGRLDSTNIICPELSIITSVGLDHTAFLGDTVEKIAKEKCGIIKENIPVVFGEVTEHTRPIFLTAAQEKNSPYTIATDAWICESQSVETNVQQFNFKRKRGETRLSIITDLMGDYQLHNVCTVLTAVDFLKRGAFPLTELHVIEGLRHVQQNTHLMGRWQLLARNPRVITDAAHNADGIRAIMPRLTQEAGNKLHCVIAMVNDKDAASMLSQFPKDANYYFSEAQIPRALGVENLRGEAAKCGLEGNAYPTIADAIEAAIRASNQDDLIFIGASAFTAAEAIAYFNQAQ